jgi:hypothetical protein
MAIRKQLARFFMKFVFIYLREESEIYEVAVG